QSTVAEPYHARCIDVVEKPTHLLSREYRRLSFLDAVAWASHRRCGIEWRDLSGHQPVKEHPYRREVLLNHLRRALPGQLFYVGGDKHGLDGREASASSLAPFEESSDSPGVGKAGVLVSNVGGEELDEAPGGLLPLARDDVREREGSGLG